MLNSNLTSTDREEVKLFLINVRQNQLQSRAEQQKVDESITWIMPSDTSYIYSHTHNPIAWLVSLAYNRSHWLSQLWFSCFRITCDLIAISINFIIPALPEIREKPRTKLIAYGVELSWTAPKNSLKEIILYNITCFICSQSICNIPCQNEAYNPGPNNLRQISVTVSNLIAGGNYVFRVYVSVKDAVPEGEWRYIETDRVQVISGKELYTLRKYNLF
jgi:hypothetical protein